VSGPEPTRGYLDIAARIILLPVLLGQALWVRRTYVVLPEPEGARRGVVGNGPPLRLLIIGDSSAAGVGVTTQEDALLGQLTGLLEGHRTTRFELLAQTGARTADVLDWLDAGPAARYDFVITALGVNDVTKGVTLRRWVRQQSMLMDRISTQFQPRRIIISGLPPIGQFPLLPHPLRWVLGRQATRFDQHLHGLAAGRDDCVALKFNMELDDSNMSADGYHPGAAVYTRWAEEVAKVILADRD